MPTVDYDREAPSNVFSSHQIAYVESISSYLSPEELATVRRIEWLMNNLNSNAFGESFIPGLRDDMDIRGVKKGFIYVRRFSSASYTKMMDLFMAHVPEDFPKSGSGGNMPGYRVTLPNGARFNPVEFFGNLAAWRKRLQESADLHGSELAHFDKGAFVTSNGQRINFGDLRVELLEARRYPKDW